MARDPELTKRLRAIEGRLEQYPFANVEGMPELRSELIDIFYTLEDSGLEVEFTRNYVRVYGPTAYTSRALLAEIPNKRRPRMFMEYSDPEAPPEPEIVGGSQAYSGLPYGERKFGNRRDVRVRRSRRIVD